MLWALWVLWALTLSGTIFGLRRALRSSTRQVVGVVAIALIAFVLRGGITGDNFYGLEYEDAYVYSAAARQSGWSHDGFGFEGLAVCAAGSLEHCSELEVFPGHLPGFPALLRAVQAITGYRVWLGPVVGAVVSSAAAVAIWWSAWAIYRSFFAANIAACLFAATPCFALYGGSATSESVSSLPIAVAIGAAALTRRATRTSNWLSWHAIAFGAVILSAMVRRENAILIAVMPVCLLIRATIASPRFRLLAWVIWISAAVFIARLAVPSAVLEVSEYGQFSFGIGRALETLPAILRALVTLRWFGLTAIAAALGLIGAGGIARGKRSVEDVGLLFAVTAAALGMIAMYGAHVRSTYQLMGVAVEPFDFLRYLANVGVLLCILVPAAAHFGKEFPRGMVVRRLVFAIGVVYLALSARASWMLRQDMITTEQEVRLEPAIAAIHAAESIDSRFPIVTLEPLVVQLYGTHRTNVIALEFLTSERIRASGGRIFYVRQEIYNNDVNRRRYADFLSLLPVDDPIEVRKGPGWTVLALGKTTLSTDTQPNRSAEFR